MPKFLYHKAHDMLMKALKKQCSTILDRWYKDDLYRGSLSKLGWDEETIMEYDKIALEDHSYTDKRRKTSERELMEALINRRGCKWTNGSARRL